MTINLIEIAIKAQENMIKDRTYITGVKNVMEWLKSNKTYEGTYLDCIDYINNKIPMASLNAVTNKNYIGCIALYSAMIDELLYLAKKEGK